MLKLYRNPFNTKSNGFAKVAACRRPGIAYALLLAFGMQAGLPAWAWEPSHPSVAPESSSASPVSPLDLGGPTVSEFKTAFPSSAGRAVQKVDPVTFSRFVNSHAGKGRLLTGLALATVVAGTSEPGTEAAAYSFNSHHPINIREPEPKPKFDPLSLCRHVPLKQRKKCRDSIKVVVQRKSDSIRVEYDLRPGDSLIVGEILAEELDPPYQPPVIAPFSFKDSIPDLDTNYAAPSKSMGEAGARRDHRKLVRRYQAYRDSVSRDSLARGSERVSGPPRMLADCDTVAPPVRERCRDSLTGTAVSPHAPMAIREMQEREITERGNRDTERENRADHTRVDEDLDDDGRHHNWFVNIFADVREGGGGGGGWDSDDWAAVIYVVIGVVVVGAFVIYGVQMLGEMAINQGDYPLFMEAGVRLSYSGKAIEDQQGVGKLYRDAYLAGLRFAIGFDRPGMGIGLAAEGGYIDVFLRSSSDPARTFDFKGGYLVAGPMIRFGDNNPWSFSLEFLNGTSTHEAIGWISKSRMTLQAKVSEHMLVGGHLGAVFYDLHFFDGLGLRQGNFNRDLSLVWGLDTGWEF